jgi:3-methyladenine DNA glycosylase/8-oxoguanine DNA glycosylase
MTTHHFQYGETELTHLRGRDKKLAAAIDKIGIIQREVNPYPLSALIDSIVSQQISARAAATVAGRLYDLCNGDYKTLHRLSREEIQACGMSMRKAGYIKGIAEAEHSAAIDFDALPAMGDTEIIRTLTALPGVGVWTVEMLLIFSLQRPNVVSFGDLAIRRGMMKLYGLKELPKEKFTRYAKRYAPYGSVASLYLWELSH